jgi:hypothetical protein
MQKALELRSYRWHFYFVFTPKTHEIPDGAELGDIHN